MAFDASAKAAVSTLKIIALPPSTVFTATTRVMTHAMTQVCIGCHKAQCETAVCTDGLLNPAVI